MRVPSLPFVAQFSNGQLFASRHEDRIEAEAFAPAPFLRDSALERPRSAELFRRGRDADQLADIAGATPLPAHVLQLPQQPPDLVTRCASRGMDSRATAEP